MDGALHRREGQRSTAGRGKQRLSTPRCPQDGQEKPLLRPIKDLTPLSFIFSKGGHRYNHEPPLIPLQTGLCKPSSSPRTERPLFKGLVTRVVISIGKHMVYRDTEAAVLGTAPLHGTAEPRLYPAGATEATRMEEGRASRSTSCLRSGVEKQPHHQPLATCSAESGLPFWCTS